MDQHSKLDANIKKAIDEADAMYNVVDELMGAFGTEADALAATSSRCLAFPLPIPKQSEVASHIQVLSQEHSDLVSRKKALVCEKEARRKKTELEESLQFANENVSDFEGKGRQLVAREAALEEQERQWESDKKLLIAGKIENDQARSKLALYTHITQIHWDPPSTAQHAIGTVLSSRGNGVLAVDIVAGDNEVSEFEAVKRFWDYIDS